MAKGRADALVTLRRTYDWDVAAGALMVAEAGGAAATSWGEEPLFNQRKASLPGLVAGPKPLVADVLSRL